MIIENDTFFILEGEEGSIKIPANPCKDRK